MCADEVSAFIFSLSVLESNHYIANDREARHPNIVQYIGLTKSPGLTGRIYIISEFVGGNLRSYIADVSKTFSRPMYHRELKNSLLFKYRKRSLLIGHYGSVLLLILLEPLPISMLVIVFIETSREKISSLQPIIESRFVILDLLELPQEMKKKCEE